MSILILKNKLFTLDVIGELAEHESSKIYKKALSLIENYMYEVRVN